MKLPYILESLEKVKDQTTLLSGLWSKSAEPPEGTTGSDHWVAAAFLTGNKPRKTAAADATVFSPTIDQIIARRIGADTLLPSLQLALEDPNSSSSNCGEGYSCSYTNSISWVGLPTPEGEELRTGPLPMELNPKWCSSDCLAVVPLRRFVPLDRGDTEHSGFPHERVGPSEG